MPLDRKPSPTMTVVTTVYLAGLIWFVGVFLATVTQIIWSLVVLPDDPIATLIEEDPNAASGFMLFAFTSQSAFVILSLVMSWILVTAQRTPDHAPPTVRRGLGIRAPALKLWVWPLLLGSNLFLWWGAQMLFSLFFTEQGEHLEDLSVQIQSIDTPLIAALTLLAVGILPGFGEEFIFRGFMLQRLRGVIPAWLAITLVASLFALSHIDLQQAILIFPLGLWWTFVSWRARSVWPGVALHAMNNSWTLFVAWGLYDIIIELSTTTLVAILALTAICFLASIAALCGPGIKEQHPTPATEHA